MINSIEIDTPFTKFPINDALNADTSPRKEDTDEFDYLDNDNDNEKNT